MSDFSPGDQLSSAAAAALESGSAAGAGSYVAVDANNEFVLDSTPGGGGSTDPGGSDTQIQYNNDGAFGGLSAFVWNNNASSLEISNNTVLSFGLEGGSAASFIKRDSSADYLIISGTAGNGTIISGSIYVHAVPSGTLAGAGSYVGVDSNNKLVLAAAAGGSGSPAGSDTQLQYNNGGAFGGVAALTYDDGAGDLTVIDDTKLNFGTNNDASIEYDENNTNKLIISGATAGFDINLEDNAASALEISQGPNAYMTFVTTNGDESVSSGKLHGFAAGLVVEDDQFLYFGSDADASIEYDENGSDELIISGAQGGIDIQVPHNVADALTISSEGSAYMTFGSEADDELITSGKLHAFSAGLIMEDDKAIYFGSADGGDANMEYDEDNSNKLIISGAAGGFDINMEDNAASAFEISQGPNTYMTFDTSNGDESISSGKLHAFAAGGVVEDDQKMYFGSDADASIEYDEDGSNELIISGAQGGIDIQVPISSADALTISTEDHTYMTFGTEVDDELITCGQMLAIAGHLIIEDDIKVYFGSADGGDASIEYDEDGTDRLTISGSAAGINITGSVYIDRETLAVSGSIGVNKLAPLVPLDVVWEDVTTLSNDTGGGDVVVFGSASGPLTAGALYYLNPHGGWASASAATTGSHVGPATQTGGGHSQLLGIALGATPADNGMLVRGYFDVTTYFSGAFIKGQAIYIESGSAYANSGVMSGAAPTATDSYARIVGYATDTANVIYFNPGATWVELS